MLTAIALATSSAVLFGAGTALQAQATLGSNDGAGRQPLAAVARRPRWLLGTALDWLGALTHVVALHFGPLAVVQPIALSAVVVATSTAALLEHRRLGRDRLGAALATAAGLALVAVCLGQRLRPGHLSPAAVWLSTVAAGLAVVVPLLVSRRSRRPDVQARFLGAAAGASCGLSAVLMRAVQVLQVHSVLDPLRLLAVVAALGTGFLGLVLTQAAFARGRVTTSLPTQDLAALVVSIGAGAAVVGEVPGLGPWTMAGALTGLLLAARGSRRLAREPGAPASGPLLVTPQAAEDHALVRR
jgi:hypothetical protein